MYFNNVYNPPPIRSASLFAFLKDNIPSWTFHLFKLENHGRAFVMALSILKEHLSGGEAKPNPEICERHRRRKLKPLRKFCHRWCFLKKYENASNGQYHGIFFLSSDEKFLL